MIDVYKQSNQRWCQTWWWGDLFLLTVAIRPEQTLPVDDAYLGQDWLTGVFHHGRWCPMSRLSLVKSRWVGRLTNKLMDKADNSWPILSLLMYWGHWLPRISMNTFWMILCILFVRKLYLFFDHLICALLVHRTLMRSRGYCHNSLMCSRPWTAPLYLIVCYVRANELNFVSRLMRRRRGHHALVTGHHWLACHLGLQTRGQWPHTCYQPPSQHWHWPTEHSHHSHCTHSAKYTW